MEWTDEELRRLKRLIASGSRVKEVSHKFPGRTWRACYEVAKRKGYVTNWRGGSVVRRASSAPEAAIIKRMDAERVRQGLTQIEFARKAGYNAVQWNKIVTGNTRPSIQCVADFAQALGMKLEVRDG